MAGAVGGFPAFAASRHGWRLVLMGLACLVLWPRSAAAAPAAACPWLDATLPVARRVAMVIARMTLAEEITLVEGHGVRNAEIFDVPPIARLCLPAIGME
ncbi:MAG: hypothetical protein ACREFJ_06175, partial [Acetobacteraceae bacterium]